MCYLTALRMHAHGACSTYLLHAVSHPTTTRATHSNNVMCERDASGGVHTLQHTGVKLASSSLSNICSPLPDAHCRAYNRHACIHTRLEGPVRPLTRQQCLCMPCAITLMPRRRLALLTVCCETHQGPHCTHHIPRRQYVA